MLSALAFMPVSDVIVAFNTHCNIGLFPDDAQPVLDYFENAWIGRPQRRNGRRAPRFQRSLWNCCESVNAGLPKTNNALEDSRGFAELLSCNHPSVWKFIMVLKTKLECGPMPNLMVALPNIGGALCSTPQSLADAHY